jgi:hypothetical protein
VLGFVPTCAERIVLFRRKAIGVRLVEPGGGQLRILRDIGADDLVDRVAAIDALVDWLAAVDALVDRFAGAKIRVDRLDPAEIRTDRLDVRRMDVLADVLRYRVLGHRLTALDRLNTLPDLVATTAGIRVVRLLVRLVHDRLIDDGVLGKRLPAVVRARPLVRVRLRNRSVGVVHVGIGRAVGSVVVLHD